MLTVPGYKISLPIYESTNSVVFRGCQTKDSLPVIFKLLKEDYPTAEQITKYKQEYEITRSLNIQGAVKAHSLHKYQNTLVMILEDFGGESLKHLINSNNLTLPEFLQIAIKIASCLGEIHHKNIIHKDINPSNIVFNPKTNRVKIIDFGISTALSRENPTLKSPNVLEGTLAYMSPEQTGRMNRSLDYRTDFYSLGVTFYELLTGRLPFNATDALELVHCHIALTPTQPHKLNRKIPKAVSDIVMKLLAKTAEDRYQSAEGIKIDLQHCLTQLEKNNHIAPFNLGLGDISDKFQIPEKLYGRKREIYTLLTAFDHTSQGNTVMMLVSGYSGIGKSSLVQEIYKPITQQRAYFISGKFDQFQRSVPYSAIVSAFQSLIGQLLTESEAQLNQWKEKLLAAFGSNGQIIIDVIPEVELIVGKQPAIQELGPTESQNRFNLVFQNFIRVFCQREHSLVIFLDDLQWADSATLNLMELMMRDEQTRYLLLIGAYRDNEVSATHPLMMTLNGLHRDGATINQITLAPLELEHITHLIADTLHSDTTTVKPLAELVLRKTEGNPFFVNQFLKTLYQENLLVFNSLSKGVSKGRWEWDMERIEAMEITDNVVELMIGKLKKLQKSTQQVLRLAACVGNHFQLNTLSVIHEKSIAETYQELLTAIHEEVIIPTSELQMTVNEVANSQLLIFNYKFLHDRVQQAAYALIDEEQKKSIHLKIGRLLLANISPEERAEKMFDMVDHLNIGRELITDEQEQVELAKLNLESGQKAKDANAYAAAKEYLTTSMECLPSNSWTEHYKLSLAIYKERAEVEYLNGYFEKSQELIKLGISQANSVLEKAELYNLLIVQYALTAKPEQAIQTGRKALGLLGISLPETDLQTVLEAEVTEAKKNLGSKEIASLIHEPDLNEPEKKIAVKLLVNIDPPAYFLNADLYAVIVLKSVNLYLKYGNAAEAGKGYSTYGILLGSVWGDYQSAYDFGLLALKISEKFNNLAYKCQACFVMGNYLNSWVKPIKNAESVNHEGYQAAMQSGDLAYAGYILGLKSINRFYQGINLEESIEETSNCLMFLQKHQNQWVKDAVVGLEITIFNLTGRSGDKWNFSNQEVSDLQYLENCDRHNNFGWVCNYKILKSQAMYLYDKPSEALKYSLEAKKLLSFLLGFIAVAEHNFYYSLILAALYPTVSDSVREEYREVLETNQKQMKIWADNCPENFLHKYLLVEAEIARITGNALEAIELYDRAIESASSNAFVQNEALANELAAKFWLSQGKEKYAKAHMTEAYYAYQRWGAKRKVEDLEEKYPHFLTKTSTSIRLKDAGVTTTDRSSTGSSSNALDLATVMKASQAIAGEIVLDKLLASLMKISIENAGAQKGLLILAREGKLLIEASSSVDSKEVVVKQSTPINSCEYLPLTVINYVKRTHSDVVLTNATSEARFANDPYIALNKSKSVLCTPILNQGQLIAILYLENNLTVGAFTPDRLEVLKLLSSQAAISLENALLYASMEQKVQERTQELSQTLHELQRTQTRLIQNEKMSSLGQLVAGVAHEINNPVNFIYGNLVHVNEYTQDLLNLVQLYAHHYPNPVSEIQDETEEIEIDFLVEDLPKILSSMKVGADRIRQIVLSLRNFSRLDEAEMKAVDIHEGIDSTLLILQSRLKAKTDSPAIKVIKEYDQLPPVECYAGQLNQVFMNLLANAIDTLEEVICNEGTVTGNYQAIAQASCPTFSERGEGSSNGQSRSSDSEAISIINYRLPTIKIRTCVTDAGRVLIGIADNGCGMAEEVKKRVFDPFFTTKPVGKGTGLGLAISYQIVVEKHGGQLQCVSTVGEGTEFVVEIPIRQQH